jgi:hypothetical protein
MALFPWAEPGLSHWVPGPVPGVPPGAHLAWLAALTGLAVIAALWHASPPRRLTRLTAVPALAAAGCLAVAGWSSWAQARPVSPSAKDRLVYQFTHPAQAERCVSKQGVRYCAYPGFAPDVARWAGVVNGVLSRLPGRPAKTLVVRQVVDGYLDEPPLGDLPGPLGWFFSAQRTNPHLVPGSSVPPVYVDITWGTGPMTGSYQLGLAIQAAWWVAGLPTTWQRTVPYSCGSYCTSEADISCLPAGQAREAIALWLALSATPATRAAPDLSAPGVSKVGGTWISSYSGIPVSGTPGYLPAVQFTGQGAVLAQAMLRLPEQRVEAVLAARWPGWLSPQATDAQLARALRISLPAAPPPLRADVNRSQPADPVCR